MAGKSSLIKVIILGDGGVGRSSLINRYVTNNFDIQLFKTIGVEFLNKDLEVDGHFVTMQIWDTAGQERFRSLRTPFYRGSDCCLLTFSVDDSQSFQNFSNWKKEFIYYANVEEHESFPFVILGNKTDISERQVSSEEAQACAGTTTTIFILKQVQKMPQMWQQPLRKRFEEFLLPRIGQII
ncbi:RAB9A isoform 2 [Pan troglodytes]|uniref:small monomeric GTPase n=1 Tax=Pan troglodytes TaxID=9598 RepID=A0A2J8KUE4_PANTR|nr:RAB9A isoform 1 [Pan troglodytes]PNI38641.1 RAB9A isoform 2 [Pan troglodytes]